MKKLIFVLLILPQCILSQSVKGTFSPAKDFTYAFLYKSEPKKASYINRGELDNLGQFEIKLDSTVTPGMYKIVYALPAEENNFDFIYDGKETIAFNFSYETGVEFTESTENRLWNSYLKSMTMVNQTISNYYNSDNQTEEAFNAIFKTLKDTQKSYEENSRGKLVSVFIKSNSPYIPQSFEDVSTYSKHVKSNYLKHVDFNDYLLQSSTFLVDRVTTYIFDMVENATNPTYKQLTDELVMSLQNAEPKIKAQLLKIIWNRFVLADNHIMGKYIATNHLLEIAKINEDTLLIKNLEGYINTSIGNKAPDFEINIPKGGKTRLHKLENSEYYLLIFWSSGCGHCLKELPKVKTLLENKKNIQVVAFGLENDTQNWTEEIKRFPNFIHSIGLGKWNHPIVQTYGISATPMYFLMSKSKIIIAKPNEFEDLEVVVKDL